MVRFEHVRTLFDSTQSQEAKSEVLSISAISDWSCSRACHCRILAGFIYSDGPFTSIIPTISDYKYILNWKLKLLTDNQLENLDISVAIDHFYKFMTLWSDCLH